MQPNLKTSPCVCYVRDLDAETQLRLRPGAHDPACPVYMPSYERADAEQDATFRQRAGIGGLESCQR